MEFMSLIIDNRINSKNLLVKTTFGEYLSFANKIINNNDLQRKRVKASKTIYSLLKSDLKKGCVMPPLVIAISQTDIFIDREIDEENIDNLLDYIQNNSDKILILDGLQRTYTLMDADMELRNEGTKEEYKKFLEFELRLEIYIEINKFGVLYRMLTLNTGQTPMSARHQLEMLYRDLLNQDYHGVKLITDTQGGADPDDNEWIFKNVIEGFNSYMNRNELPIDRQELLENVRMLEKMSQENVSNDLFVEYLESYIGVVDTLRKVTKDYVITEEDLNEYEINGNPFAKKVSKAFSTSQAMTGYGAAIGIMFDKKLIDSINCISELLVQLNEKNNGYEWFMDMIVKFDYIRNSSKKIGNAQRMYFQYFFRELFNKESDSYLDLSEAVENGYRKYNSQVN